MHGECICTGSHAPSLLVMERNVDVKVAGQSYKESVPRDESKEDDLFPSHFFLSLNPRSLHPKGCSSSAWPKGGRQ